MAQPGPFFSPQFQAVSYLPVMWSNWNYIKGLNINIGRGQRKVLLDQFAEGISMADQCEKQQRGFAEIQELHNLLGQTKDHYAYRMSLHWSQVGHKKQEFDYQLDHIARGLDGLLRVFGVPMGPQSHSTFTMIQKARIDDDSWFDWFIKQIDQASPQPGSFVNAYRSQDTNSMNQMTDGVLQTQASVLAQDAELQEEAEKHAQELTKWIMGVTNQKLKPGLILGRRLVGEPKRIVITDRNNIYTAKFVSGEIVALKKPHDQMEGKDPTIMLRHFQREVSLWHSLRYDHILPFYGVGMRSEPDRTRVYGVSPFLPNRDVVTYRKEHTFSTQESLQIALDVALALRYLHERDPMVVHFNVCPKNVLINDEKRGVLGGFGLSKEIPTSDSLLSSNIASLPSDLTCFRAPEYYNDPNFPLKPSSDVWGWAMSTLELVSGETPFCEIPGGDFQAVTAMAGGIRPDRNAYPNIQQLSDPNSLWGLLEECWLHHAAKRPSMGEVAMRIKGIKEGQNELGRRDPPVVPAPGPSRRSQGTFVEPVDGRANQGTVQGRAPGQRKMSQDVVDQGRLSHAAQQGNAPWPGEGH